MKLLFYSAERAEVELVCYCLLNAGIACEIHDNGEIEGLSHRPAEAEVWLQNDADSYRAMLLCAELNVGFAKRPIVEDELPARNAN